MAELNETTSGVIPYAGISCLNQNRSTKHARCVGRNHERTSQISHKNTFSPNKKTYDKQQYHVHTRTAGVRVCAAYIVTPVSRSCARVYDVGNVECIIKMLRNKRYSNLRLLISLSTTFSLTKPDLSLLASKSGTPMRL